MLRGDVQQRGSSSEPESPSLTGIGSCRSPRLPNDGELGVETGLMPISGVFMPSSSSGSP